MPHFGTAYLKSQVISRILFIAPHRPDRSPGQRYRFEQYFEDLKKAGLQPELSYILSEEDDALLYTQGRYISKARIALKARQVRKQDLKRIRTFDLVVVFREALFTRSQFFERGVHKAGVPMVVDFDDAIWIKDVSPGNRILGVLKDPGKLARLLPMCAGATAGNSYLAAYAKPLTQSVHELPSTVDCELIYPLAKPDIPNKPIVIGWSGSPTTYPHIASLLPVFKKLRLKYGGGIEFHIVGAPPTEVALEGIHFIPWQAAQENALLNAFDIGVMPLPNTSWTQGKCGMKLLLYMAAGLPVVASPVGVNASMTHGHGLTAKTESDWFNALVALVENPDQRKSFGDTGRQFVLERYSRQAWAAPYVDILQKFIYKSKA